MTNLSRLSLADWANLSAIGQFFLVLVSLVFIWYQLRQSVKLAKAANSQSLAEQALSFNSHVTQNPEVARIWFSKGRGLEEGDLPGTLAKERYRELLVQWLILHENIHHQHQEGLLDSEIYQSWEADLQSTVETHDLALFGDRLELIFRGPFGRHLADLRRRAVARE
jgi:hypothetical protein